MCGIFAFLNNSYNKDTTQSLFMKGVNRGPDNSKLFYKWNSSVNLTVGFHRLAINGYNDTSSDQPFNIDGCMLICNGEIYNWKEIYKMLDIVPTTKSDCEVIIYLYRKYGIEYTLRLLDGVFAFVLFDEKLGKLYVARDLYGVRPMFSANTFNNAYYVNHMFASEMKQLITKDTEKIQQFPPGHCMCFDYNKGFNVFIFNKLTRFLDVPSVVNYQYIELLDHQPTTDSDTETDNMRLYYDMIYKSLYDAVKKRVDNTDREICCLLSGGLDSSLITALVSKYYKEQHPGVKIHTWSIGMKGSDDLVYAKKVADFLDTEHHSIELDKVEFLEAIPQVIHDIESYDTTTVRASVGNWLISKYIKENSNARVVFNGDGSDEVCGGYLYFHYAKNCLDFDDECKRLLKDIHYFDVLRSDRSISSHGLEARTPFLDRNFVQTYLSIPVQLRDHNAQGVCEKYLLRKTFDDKNLLPREVLWRTKEAFSDGVSSDKESWFETIQKQHSDEKMYYKRIFNQHYNHNEQVIPYYWMPNFVDATDASARTLDIYNKTSGEVTENNI